MGEATPVTARARNYWIAAHALRRPDPARRYLGATAFGYLKTLADTGLDPMLSWRAALVLESTVFADERPRRRLADWLRPVASSCDTEPEPAA